MLNENNIYNAWLKSSSSGEFDRIGKKLNTYKKNLDKKLMRLRKQAKDDLVEVLLASEQSKQIYYMSLVSSLPEDKQLGQDDARKLLDLGMGKFLAANLKKFQGLNYEIAEDIMQPDDRDVIDRSSCLRNIESFVESDRANIGKIALDFDIRAGAFINSNLDKYPGFDRRSLAQLYLSDDFYCKKILDNFDGYKGYITIDDFAEIPAEIFYETHCLEFIFDHLEDLGGDRDSFLKLIKDKYGESACDKLKKLFDIK